MVVDRRIWVGWTVPVTHVSARRFRPLRPESPAWHVTIMLATATVLAVAVGFGLWLALGHPSLGVTTLDAKDRLESIKVVLALVGGVGAVFFLTIAYRKQRHSEGAEEREDIKLFTDRFSKAAELLGHEHPATRMAGVYAMAQIADDSTDYEGRQQCVDALCSYLRLPSDMSQGEETVRGAITRVIRDHLRGYTTVQWCGHKFNLAGATFVSLDLTGIRLEKGGYITFHGARFVSGTHHFTGMALDGGRIWFTRTEFEGDRVSFRNARFHQGTVSFKEARSHAGVVVDFDGLNAGEAQIVWGPFQPPAGNG